MDATTTAAVSGRFDEMWPDTKTGQRHDYKHDTFVKWKSYRQCYKCIMPTQWVSVAFGFPLCSPRCADALWGDYFAECEESGGVCVALYDDD